MRTAVVTGATGAIGRALIEVCIEAGYEVLAVVHRSSARAAALNGRPHCRVLRLDLDEYGNAMSEMEAQGIQPEGCELFFHLAWMAPFGEGRNDLALQLDNVRYALDAVRFARALGCSAFIGTGSQAEYGRTEAILTPRTPAFPETGYGIAKLCAGQMTRLACAQAGLRHIWCRVLSVYGPYDRDETLIATAIRAMLQGAETAFTPCEQLWDYLYSEDAARALLLAGERGEDGGVYVVGSGEVRPLREYIERIAAITGYTKTPGFGKRPYNDRQVMFLQADIESLRQLGFTPRVPFDEGILQTVGVGQCPTGQSLPRQSDGH